MLKLYVIVRTDMPPGNQAVQAMHALADFAEEWPTQFQDWKDDNNTLVLLQAPDQWALKALSDKAKDGGFIHTMFQEPDNTPQGSSQQGQGNTYTAIAFAPNWTVQNVLLANLELALPRSWFGRKTFKRRWRDLPWHGQTGTNWAGPG